MNATLLIAFSIMAATILICFLLIFLGKKRSKEKRNKILEVYKEMISENQLTIGKEEIMPGKILAIDYKKNTFLFIYNHNGPVYDIIDLDAITECRIQKTGYKFTDKRSGKSISEEHINNVNLALSNKGDTLVEIPVYSEIEDGQVEYVRLLGIAEKWKKEINAALVANASRN